MEQPILVMRVMNEVLCDVPLWDDEGVATDGREYGLSESLISDLRAWQKRYEAHLDFRFNRVKYKRRHRAEGEELAERVQAELGPPWRVEFWRE